MKFFALLAGAVWVGVAVLRTLWGLLTAAWKAGKGTSVAAGWRDAQIDVEAAIRELAVYGSVGGVAANVHYDVRMRRFDVRCGRCGGLLMFVDVDIEDEAELELELAAVKHDCSVTIGRRWPPPPPDCEEPKTRRNKIRMIRF